MKFNIMLLAVAALMTWLPHDVSAQSTDTTLVIYYDNTHPINLTVPEEYCNAFQYTWGLGWKDILLQRVLEIGDVPIAKYRAYKDKRYAAVGASATPATLDSLRNRVPGVARTIPKSQLSALAAEGYISLGLP